jgi:DNA-binding IscR family transcriptional regulator
MDPERIRVKDVLETIQGPHHLMKDNGEPNPCHVHEDGFCALRELINIAEHKLLEVFEQHTLADLLRWQTAKMVMHK